MRYAHKTSSPQNPQQLLLHNSFQVKKEFGGAHLKNSHAKKARPISTKHCMHVTLRSSMAKGRYSLLGSQHRSQKIEKTVRTQAQKFGVQIQRYANVGNHLHLLVKATYRRGFLAFLRSVSGLIARIVLGAQRNHPQLQKHATQKPAAIKFWDQRPWTRIVISWTDFLNVKKYVEQNFNEAMGFVIYKPRKAKSTA